MKRILSLLIVFSLLLPALFSCAQNVVSDETDSDSATTEGSDETEAATEKATKKPKETKPADFDDQGNIALDGWSDYVIVYGADCTQSERTAAQQLQIYIKKISGATLQVVKDSEAPIEKELVVGKTNRESDGQFDRSDLGDEGFIIKTEGKKLFIVGSEVRGTLYGVFTYLEDYVGCRFYTPDFEKVPELNAFPFIEIEEDKQIPVFDSRSPGWKDLSDHTASAKLKVNGSHGRGTISELYGGNLTWAGSTVHTLYKLAEMTGDDFNHEPCLSDENVYNTVLKNVRALLAANPNAKYVSVSQNDSDTKDRACKCDACNAVFAETGSRAGIYLRFVNRIAEEIKDEYPNVMVHTLAYKFTKDVPTGVVPADNVMVQFCTIEACFRHSLEDCTNAVDKQTDFVKLIKDWSEICDYLAVWDYTTNFSFYNLTFPNFEAMYENVKLFADNNVKYVYEQGNWQDTNGEFSELKAYLLAKLLWDPYMSKEEYYAYMDEFLLDYYGEGGVKIREFIDLVMSSTSDSCATIYKWPMQIYPSSTKTVRTDSDLPANITEENLRNYRKFDWTPYYDWFVEAVPNVILSQGRVLFNEAYNMTTDTRAKQRIDKSSIQLDLLELYFENERLTLIGENIQKLAYGLANKLMSAEPDTISFVAEAISLYTTNEAKSALTAKNRAYYDKLMKYGIGFDREGKQLSPNGKYDFSKLPYYWVP